MAARLEGARCNCRRLRRVRSTPPGMAISTKHGRFSTTRWSRSTSVFGRTRTSSRYCGILTACRSRRNAGPLLYIPKTNRQFWDLLHAPYSPKDGPFVAPALSGIAMIDGLYDRPGRRRLVGLRLPALPVSDRNKTQPPLDEYLPCAEETLHRHRHESVDRDRRAQWPQSKSGSSSARENAGVRNRGWVSVSSGRC